jgi:hypothetical protein
MAEAIARYIGTRHAGAKPPRYSPVFRKAARRGIGYGPLRAYACRCILSIIATTASIKPANKMIPSLSQFPRGRLC